MSRFLLSVCLLLSVTLCLGEVTATIDGGSVASSAAAKLLVQKTIDHHQTMPFNFPRDTPINVTLTVTNVGDAAAEEVVLQDSWAAGFELSGSGTQKWESIPAGESVSVSYFVTPTSEMQFESSPARVTYQAKEGGATITGYSSSTTNLNVITPDQFARLTNTHVVEWSLFSGLFALFIVAPALKWYELSSSYVKGGRRKAE